MQANQINILLIDDDKDDCNDFRETLMQLSGMHQLTCGTESEKIFSYIEQTKPDLIFLDINLPNKNGIQCLKELKMHDVYKRIPVIVYSVSDDPIHKEQSRTLGAHHYLVKPYKVVNLSNSLKKIINKDWKIAQSLPQQEDFVIGLEFT